MVLLLIRPVLWVLPNYVITAPVRFSNLMDQGLPYPIARSRGKAPSADELSFVGPVVERKAKGTGQILLYAHQDTLFQIYGFHIAAIDLPDGKLQWRITVEKPIAKAMLSEDASTLYVLETQTSRRNYGRWGAFNAAAVTAIDTGGR